MAIVELKDITYVREGQTILASLSWRIEPGQHWALLGANGSGKTTLLKVITGYEWPSDGEVAVLGQRFGECDLRELRKMVGWVSSAVLHQFPWHNTARDVVASGLDAVAQLLIDYHALTHSLHDEKSLHNDKALRELEALQQKLDAADAWRANKGPRCPAMRTRWPRVSHTASTSMMAAIG